jgi:hypothetical protein
MARTDEQLIVPAEVEERPQDQRAIQIRPVLSRLLPFWGHPSYLSATRWRAFVRNQPLALVFRDTLINHMLSSEWDIQPRDPDDEDKDIGEAIEYYTELFDQGLDEGFDHHLELIAQDYLDLPIGGTAELGRLDDDPDGPVVWAQHVDAATLYPTYDYDYPLRQALAEAPGRVVAFPRHAVERIYMTPRPEIMRKGWGMAPPEKAYLAMELLFRGDRYYANLLLDTPEAGILDLKDMEKESALEWVESMRELFFGIDGFKVPVLYEHNEDVKWIPLNRPPLDMMYDKVTMKYAQIMAGAYGLRLSDIGLDEVSGERTLAGVIRGERQSKRSGYGRLGSALENYFNKLLPHQLKFRWLDRDEETIVAKGKAMISVGQGLKVLKDGGFIDQAEGRKQLVAEGLFSIDLDPDKVPEPPMPTLPPGINPFGNTQPANGKPPQPSQNDKVAPSDGGRGEIAGPVGRSAVTRIWDRLTGRATPEPGSNPAIVSQEELLERMEAIIKPGLMGIVSAARSEPVRLRRLIRAMTKHMVPEMVNVVKALSDYQIHSFYLPEMHALTFGEPSELDSLAMRNILDEAKKVLDTHLEDDDWWKTASAYERASILSIFAEAYERGLAEQALLMIRALYEEGLRPSPAVGISFELTNPAVIRRLQESAGLLVRRIDEGTMFFIRRLIVAGVRQGLASDRIAAALRDGARAEAILADEGYMADVIEAVLEGMIEMSEARTNSIVNTEINRVENEAKRDQMKQSGLATKGWRHLGKRGVTEAGNEHPCPICKGNEDLGFVPIDYVYATVFEEGAQTPPGHPNVCHCSIRFDESELFNVVGRGEFTPWAGD